MARVGGRSTGARLRGGRNAYFNRSGPRLVDSLEILAYLFHPDRFPPPLAEPQQAWRRVITRDARLVPEDA